MIEWSCRFQTPVTLDSEQERGEREEKREEGREREGTSRVVQSPLDGQTVGRTDEFPIDI